MVQTRSQINTTTAKASRKRKTSLSTIQAAAKEASRRGRKPGALKKAGTGDDEAGDSDNDEKSRNKKCQSRVAENDNKDADEDRDEAVIVQRRPGPGRPRLNATAKKSSTARAGTSTTRTTTNISTTSKATTTKTARPTSKTLSPASSSSSPSPSALAATVASSKGASVKGASVKAVSGKGASSKEVSKVSSLQATTAPKTRTGRPVGRPPKSALKRRDDYLKAAPRRSPVKAVRMLKVMPKSPRRRQGLAQTGRSLGATTAGTAPGRGRSGHEDDDEADPLMILGSSGVSFSSSGCKMSNSGSKTSSNTQTMASLEPSDKGVALATGAEAESLATKTAMSTATIPTPLALSFGQSMAQSQSLLSLPARSPAKCASLMGSPAKGSIFGTGNLLSCQTPLKLLPTRPLLSSAPRRPAAGLLATPVTATPRGTSLFASILRKKADPFVIFDESVLGTPRPEAVFSTAGVATPFANREAQSPPKVLQPIPAMTEGEKNWEEEETIEEAEVVEEAETQAEAQVQTEAVLVQQTEAEAVEEVVGEKVAQAEADADADTDEEVVEEAEPIATEAERSDGYETQHPKPQLKSAMRSPVKQSIASSIIDYTSTLSKSVKFEPPSTAIARGEDGLDEKREEDEDEDEGIPEGGETFDMLEVSAVSGLSTEERRPPTKSPTKEAQQAPAELPSILKGAVFYVDVKTQQGRDANNLFVPLLEELGAVVVADWNLSHPAVTHVLFNDGDSRTLERVAAMKGAVRCVNIGWAMDCERYNKWMNEAEYQVQMPSALQSPQKRHLSPYKAGSRTPTAAVPMTPHTFLSAKSDWRTPINYLPGTPQRSPLFDESDKENMPTPDTATCSPGTPSYLNPKDLVQKTCPPKQINRPLFAVSGNGNGTGTGNYFRQQLLMARRRSLQVSSQTSPTRRVPGLF